MARSWERLAKETPPLCVLALIPSHPFQFYFLKPCSGEFSSTNSAFSSQVPDFAPLLLPSAAGLYQLGGAGRTGRARNPLALPSVSSFPPLPPPCTRCSSSCLLPPPEEDSADHLEEVCLETMKINTRGDNRSTPCVRQPRPAVIPEERIQQKGHSCF